MDENENPYAIHEAIREGKVAIVEALLKVRNKLASRKDNDGRLPIHWAASANNLTIVTLLAQQNNFNPDVEDDSGWTPLMIAVNVADSDAVVDFLLVKGSDYNKKNASHQTVMHFIASKKKLGLAQKLLDCKPPAVVRVKDKRGQYPIHRAAAGGSFPMVQLLLKADSPINAVDNFGSTPLHHAIAEGHGDVAILLLKSGADPSKIDNDGYTALAVAPDKEVVKYIVREAEREGINL